jgi:hypothetical protein
MNSLLQAEGRQLTTHHVVYMHVSHHQISNRIGYTLGENLQASVEAVITKVCSHVVHSPPIVYLENHGSMWLTRRYLSGIVCVCERGREGGCDSTSVYALDGDRARRFQSGWYSPVQKHHVA